MNSLLQERPHIAVAHAVQPHHTNFLQPQQQLPPLQQAPKPMAAAASGKGSVSDPIVL